MEADATGGETRAVRGEPDPVRAPGVPDRGRPPELGMAEEAGKAS